MKWWFRTVLQIVENLYLFMTVPVVFCAAILPQTAQLLLSLANVHSFDWKQNKHSLIPFCSLFLSVYWCTQKPRLTRWRTLHQTAVQWRSTTQSTIAKTSKPAEASQLFLVGMVLHWFLLHPVHYFAQASVGCVVWCCLCQLYLDFLPRSWNHPGSADINTLYVVLCVKSRRRKRK